MRSFLGQIFGVIITLVVLGCGSSEPVMLKTEGQVIKDGKNFVPEEGENLKIVFCPMTPDGKPPRNIYLADVNQKTGAFVAMGPHKKGLPPGKYRVAMELLKKKKDIFQDKYTIENSPFVFDIDDKSKPITVDLDKG